MIFSPPRTVSSIDDCDFYHTMEIPGVGVVEGAWDLRATIDAYLGYNAFAGSRVLEIGPASGYITFEMERRGASVVCVEVADDPGWDFVPYPSSVLQPILPHRREHIRRLKNSFWFGHAATNSKAKVYYGDAYRLPAELGEFDIALMSCVLLHCRAPLQIVEQCAMRAKKLVIVDLLYTHLEGKPVCELHPTIDNTGWDTWWHLSSDLLKQFLGVMGFTKCRVDTSAHLYDKTKYGTVYTITAERP